MALDEQGTVDTLDAARAVFRNQIASHQGRVIDTAGDSVLAVFPTASGAIAAALVVQQQLEEALEGVPPENSMRFRIGLHLGDVIEKDDGSVYGDGVNIAARLQALADAGGIVVSDSIRTAVKSKQGAGFEDLGEQPVHNMSDTVRAWRVHPGEAGGFGMSSQSGLGTAGREDRGASAPRLRLPDKPSIVVLPFSIMGGDAEQEYFADGLVEDIITELSRFRSLFVIARNTAFTFKGKHVDATRVARELGVHFLLEGGVRKAGNRVRITAQLIDGQSGHHVWAERYEDVVSDVFDLQERITRQVVGSMVTQIEDEEMRMSDRGERRYAAADDMAWRAAKAMSDAMFGGTPKRSEQAIEIAAQAIALDRSCARAWYVLSNTHAWRVFMAWAPDRSTELAVCRHAADSLLELAPNDSRSHFQRGIALEMAGETAAGAAALRRALSLNPNDATVQFFLSYVEAAEGNIARARELAAQALRMSPKDRWVGTAHLAQALCAFIDQQWQALHDFADLAIQAQATHPIRRVLMIAFAAEVGDKPLLRKHLGRLQTVSPDFIASLFRGDYRPLHRPEHMALLLKCLRKAGLGS